MLMNLNAETEPIKNYRLRLIGILSGGSLLLVLIAAMMKIDVAQPVLMSTGDSGLIKVLGHALFTNYVLPFEISSVLFLSAMIGAVIIGKKE
jgi:NADH-quinone oxidoreductase subunit J